MRSRAWIAEASAGAGCLAIVAAGWCVSAGVGLLVLGLVLVAVGVGIWRTTP